MKCLSDIRSGSACRVTWMIGKLAEDIRTFCRFEEDDTLFVLTRSENGVVVCDGDRKYAMDSVSASAIKVEPV